MIFCWGNGSYGQLGLGEEGASKPAPFCRGPPVGQEVTLVACGERHTLLLLADGSVASCGDNAQGQLGRRLPGGQQRCYVPGQIQALETQTVVYISCGKEHSLAICNRGQVFSWGAGGFGQLGSGNRRDRMTPLKINALSMYNVIQVACGHYHSIALTKDGRVFSWGQNIHGQLGLGKRPSSQESPHHVSSLAGIPLAQVAAGGAHSFVLSHSGVVYGWGKNNAHQLGLSQRPPKEQIFKPCSISALRNLEVTYISCGDEHTAVLTKSGRVFTFGDDSAGQLGHSSSTQNTGPQKVDGIDGPVSQVSCGSYHTLCISASGQLRSFGHGPLQHSENATIDNQQDERKCINISAPLPPDDLLGVEVQQIVAGTHINFVITIQLWLGDALKMTNDVLKVTNGYFSRNLKFNPILDPILSESLKDWVLPLVQEKLRTMGVAQDVNPANYAKNFHYNTPDSTTYFLSSCLSQTCLPAAQPSASSNTATSLDVLPRISQLDRGLIEKWKSTDLGSQQIARREIEAIFSSPPCLTGSFLKPRSALESSNCIPVDLQKAREVLAELTMRDWIARQISISLLNQLIPALPRSSPHQEALAVFLLLPECSAALEAQEMQSLALPFAEAVIGLNRGSSDILEKYWSMLPASFLEQIVQMLKKAVSAMLPFYYIVPKAQKWLPLLKVLKKLYKINMKATCKLQLTTFCIDDMPDKINLVHDLGRWCDWIESSNVEEDDSLISFCRFPFVYNVLAKMSILHCQSVLTQESIKSEAVHEVIHNHLLRITSELPKLPVFMMKVQRQNLVEDTWCKLSQAEDSCLKMQLLIQFEDEMTYYESSGILLEFFSRVFEKIVHPDYGMFMYCDHNSPLWFPPKLSVEKNKYFLFGVLCGLSIANRVTAYIPLPLAVFKKLLGKKPSLSDVKELCPVLGKSLQAVLDYEYEDFEDVFQLYYSISWGNMDVDLIPNGVLKAVNSTNKKEFISKYVDYIFNKSVDDVFKEFERGFYKVLDKRIIGFFEPEQLMEVAIGNDNYDWDMYEKNAVYCDMYNPAHPTIRMFWEVFQELTLEDKKGFLVFVAGSDRIPVTGNKSWKIKICPYNMLSEDVIPEARICHHLLLLPIYSSKEKLKDRLLCAIKNNQGFF